MLRLPVALIALTIAAPVQAAGPGDLCAGWIGNWNVLEDSTLTKDATWKPDGDDKIWRVEALGDSKCRFYFGESRLEFDIDTSHGFYDVISYVNGKPQPVDRGTFVSQSYQGPRRWAITVGWPAKKGSSRRVRLEMVMAGDLFLYYLQESATAGAPFLPLDVTFHRRAPTP